MTERHHDIVEITAELRHKTDLAFLIFDGDRAVWVPRAAVEDNGDGTFSMPDGLALEKGLI